MKEAPAVRPKSSTRHQRKASHSHAATEETQPHSHRHHRHRSSSGNGGHRHGSRPSKMQRQPQPPPPSQFVIEKQGSLEEDLWHTRVLTTDAPHHRLYLSKAKNVEELCHRCMVRIDAVKLWPTFNSLRIGEPFESAEAKRTVCIKGLVGVKPSALPLFTRLFGPSTSMVSRSSLVGRIFSSKKQRKAEEVEEAQTAASKYRDPHLQPALRGGSYGDWRDISEFDNFMTEVWMIRAMTAKDLQLLGRALRETLPETGVLKGFNRAMGAAKLSADE